MRAANESDKTGNAWTERVDYLRQLVDDQYDTFQDTTPEEFVEWVVECADEEFGPDDERVLLRRARELRKEASEAN